jgi:hypothetical protein
VDEVGFVEQFKPGAATSVAEFLARAAAMPDRTELEEAAAARAAADARAEQRETTAMLNRMQGDPIGNVSRCQAAVAEARDQVTDLENQLETARGRLGRATENLAHWSQAADEIMATARRTSGDPMEQASRRAHQAFAEVTRAKIAARAAGAPQQAPRPFAGRGSVTRSQPVTCKLCIKYGATPEQSFLIHADPSPEPVPAIPS